MTETTQETQATETSTTTETANTETTNTETTETPNKETQTETKTETQPEVTLKLAKDSLLSETDLQSIQEMAKGKGFDQKQAEELMEAYEDTIGGYHDKLEKEHKEKVQLWEKDAKESKTFKEDEELIDQALEKYAGDDLRKALKESGYNNFPALRNFLKQIGNAMKDDTVVKGNNAAPAGEEKTLGETLFPEMAARAKENAAKMQ